MNTNNNYSFEKYNFPFIVTGSYALYIQGKSDGWGDIDLIVPYYYKDKHINHYLLDILKTDVDTLWFINNDYHYPQDVDIKEWKDGEVRIHVHHVDLQSLENLLETLDSRIMPSNMIIQYQKAQIPLDKLARLKYEKIYFSNENKHEILRLEHSVCFQFEGLEYGLYPVLKLGGFEIMPTYNTDKYVGCYEWAEWFLNEVTKTYTKGDVVPYIKNIVKI